MKTEKPTYEELVATLQRTLYALDNALSVVPSEQWAVLKSCERTYNTSSAILTAAK